MAEKETFDNKVNKEQEINLNLKIPQSDDGGGFRQFVLTIYNARRAFLVCTLAFLLLAVAAAAAAYKWWGGRSGSSEPEDALVEVSVRITFNYGKTSVRVFPDGSEFDMGFFYEGEIWTKALEEISRTDVSLADAIAQVEIVNSEVARILEMVQNGRVEAGAYLPYDFFPSFDDLPANIERNTYLLSFPPSSGLFSTEEKKALLVALTSRYRERIVERYSEQLSGRDVDSAVLITTPLVELEEEVASSTVSAKTVAAVVFVFLIGAGLFLAYTIAVLKRMFLSTSNDAHQLLVVHQDHLS